MEATDETYIVNTTELSTGDLVLWIEINGSLKKVHNARLNVSKEQRTIEISGSDGKISIKQFQNSRPKNRIVLP